MPRSGTTILGNLLAQNPRFYVTPTSGLPNMITGLREGYDKVAEFRAARNDEELLGILRGVMFGSYESVDRPVIISRHRSWPCELELAEALLRRKGKFIICVRDLPEILGSLEKIWRDNKAFSSMSAFTQGNAIVCRSLEGRCNYWVSQDHIVGYAYVAIQDALMRGFRDRMHFVHFDDLTRVPKDTMQGIYKFLEEEPFEHDFENVKQVIFEDDNVHGVKGLHDIRKAVRPIPKRAKELLGPLAERFRGPYIWDDFLTRLRP